MTYILKSYTAKMRLEFALHLLATDRQREWGEVQHGLICEYVENFGLAEIRRCWDYSCTDIEGARDEIYEFLVDAARSGELKEMVWQLDEFLELAELPAWEEYCQGRWEGDAFRMKISLVEAALAQCRRSVLPSGAVEKHLDMSITDDMRDQMEQMLDRLFASLSEVVVKPRETEAHREAC